MVKRLLKVTLQTKLIGAFILATIIVVGYGYVGYSSVSTLGLYLDNVEADDLSRVQSVLRVMGAQERMMTIERTLMDSTLAPGDRAVLAQLDLAQRQIADDAWATYVSLPHADERVSLIESTQTARTQWLQDHQESMDLAQRFVDTGDETILDDLRTQSLTQSGTSWDALSALLLQIADVNAVVAQDGRTQALDAVARDQTILLGGMIGAGLLALIIGIALSMAISRPIKRSTESISAVSSQLAATVTEQERTISQQSAAINQTTTTMTELNASAHKSAQQADVVAARSGQTLELAQGGVGVIKHTQQDMVDLRAKVNAIAQQILHLSERTSQISSITNLVSDLANQTNMLALNAAVEAARAGEHGKGFAVVAAEVRKLADQSKKSTERISALVEEIQSATNATVMVTEEGSKTVEKGILSAEQAVAMFHHITDTVTSTVESTEQISLNMKQQAGAIQQVTQAMSELNMGMVETSGAVGQTRDGVLEMNQIIQHLKAMI